MIIRLLKDGYKKDSNFHRDFLDGNIESGDYLSDIEVELDSLPDFMPYIGNVKDSKNELFKEGIHAIESAFLNVDMEYIFSDVFWHSYFCVYKRDFLMEHYGEELNNETFFRNQILKRLTRNNYIYKYILSALYVSDNVKDVSKREHYYDMIINNLDVFNYIITYELFRNDKFLVNVLDIIDKNNLSDTLKKTIKGIDSIGSDERYGRRVMYELNKCYPIIPAPMLEKEQLEEYFMKFFRKYYKENL